MDKADHFSLPSPAFMWSGKNGKETLSYTQIQAEKETQTEGRERRVRE